MFVDVLSVALVAFCVLVAFLALVLSRTDAPLAVHRWFRYLGMVVGCGFGVVGGTSVQAQDDVAGPAGNEIRTFREYWAIAPEVIEAGLPYRFEVDVLFYDPEWEVLWVHDGVEGEYIAASAPLPIKTGQRVVVSGLTGPNETTVTFNNPDIEVLGEADARATPVNLAEIAHFSHSDQLVEIRGVVDQQTFDDDRHLRLVLSAQGRLVSCWVMIEPDIPVPQLIDANVRVRGVYAAKFDPSGTLASIELFCGKLDWVQFDGWLDDDPQFERPISEIVAVEQTSSDQLVRIRGTLISAEPGRSAIIRDETAQIEVRMGQSRGLVAHTAVEAVGFPWPEADRVVLRQGTLRLVAADSSRGRGDALPTLYRLAANVMELPAETAAQRQPVRMTGVVIWSDPRAPFLYVQDSTGGVRVKRVSLAAPVPGVGEHVAVFGSTIHEGFAPAVEAERISYLGEGLRPRAKAITLEHAMTGVEEAQWVELSGVLRRVTRDGGWARMEILTTSGLLLGRARSDDVYASMLGSVVTVSGVCAALIDDGQRLTGVQLWINGPEDIRIDEGVPDDVFDLPTSPLASLGRFSTAQAQQRRIKIEGTVLQSGPGQLIHLAEGDATIRLQTRSGPTLPRGARIEAVGFSGREGGRLVMREAVYRQIGVAETVPEEVTVAAFPLTSGWDGRLIKVEGSLIEQSATRDELVLILQNGRTVFEARMAREDPEAAWNSLWPVGGQLAVTGVCVFEYGELAEPRAFHVRLNSPDDVEVRRTPSWFTPVRIAWLGGVSFLAVVGSLMWVRQLRRRVTVQTAQIEHQLERETQVEADLRRASRLESLNTLAGSIAKDFGVQLSSALDQLTDVRSRFEARGVAAEELAKLNAAVIRARDLSHRLSTIADGRTGEKARFEVAPVLREAVRVIGPTSPLRCDLAVEDKTREFAFGDPSQIRQAVQNIVMNAEQASGEEGVLTVRMEPVWVNDPDEVWLRPGYYVRLSFCDNGEGIAADNLHRVFEPYFSTRKGAQGLGLATVYAIMRQHGGKVTIESKAMVGTTVFLWLPTDAPGGA